MRDKDFFIKKYNPVTRAMCFLEVDFEQLGEYMYERYKRLNAEWELPWEVEKIALTGSFTEKLQQMLPLTYSRLSKELIIKTKSKWIMYTSNGRFGANSSDEGSYLAEKLGAQVISVVLVEDIRGGSQIGSVQFAYQDYTKQDQKHEYRILSAHKESRWEWEARGTPLPFEETENYSLKKIKDRLTMEMVERYCQHFGIELFNPDFYEGDAYILHTYTNPNSVLLYKYPNQ